MAELPNAPAVGFELVESVQARWRAVKASPMFALVRAGARFDRGVLAERERGSAA